MRLSRSGTPRFSRLAGPVRLARRSAARPDDGFDRKLIAPMILGSLLNPVNSSIIAVSLVPIGRAFGALASQRAWLVSALYLATAIGQPVVGRLVDIYGPRRLFLAGSALTGVAGLLGTLAPNLGVLIAARVVLGFGTCAGYPAAMYLIRSEARRTGHDSPNGVLTALAVAGQTTVVIGPALGGMLIGLGGWRTTFAVNLPLAIAGLVLGARRLPAVTPVEREQGAQKAGRLDVAGILLFAVMLTALLLFLMSLRPDHWYLLVIVVAAGVGLTVRELRVAEPFLDLRLLRGNIALLATYGRNLLAMTVSYTFLYGYTQWMEDSRGLSASQAGLVLLPMSLAGIVVAGATGRRTGIRGKLLVGAAAQVAGCALLLFLHPGSAIWLLVALAVIVGIPQGLNSLANQNAVYHQADPVRIGSSAGLLRTFTYLGAMIASAASGAFFGRTASTGGLHHLGAFVLVIAVMFLLVTALDRALSRVGGTIDEPTGAPKVEVRR
jgi:MFS family permease